MGHHGTTDKSAQGNGAPRIFHYTVVEHYNKIVRDAVIRPARRVASGRPTSRLFSTHPEWEPTATKARKDPKTGKIHRATWTEMQHLCTCANRGRAGNGAARAGGLSLSERHIHGHRTRACLRLLRVTHSWASGSRFLGT
jgi:hypothetical protein